MNEEEDPLEQHIERAVLTLALESRSFSTTEPAKTVTWVRERLLMVKHVSLRTVAPIKDKSEMVLARTAQRILGRLRMPVSANLINVALDLSY